MSIRINVKGLHPDAILPHKATKGAAGYDLFALEDTYVYKMSDTNKESHKVRTGLALAIPEGYVGLLIERSSLHGKGATLANNVGVIDSDYRGEVLIAVTGLHNETLKIEKGQRIAQLVITTVPESHLVVTENLDETNRATGGFGSTGA